MSKIEWKDKYSKTTKPKYDELLDFFQPHIRELFILFEHEMDEQFKVKNKYHHYLKTIGWTYGYGRSYGYKLLTITIQGDCFNVLGVPVMDKKSLYKAITEAHKIYKDGFEENYSTLCEKRRKNQIERTKNRMKYEKVQMEKITENISTEKFNQFTWCKKVSRNDILRLYQSEAKGMIDEILLDEVGYGFYTRCTQAKEAHELMEKGQMLCLKCGRVLPQKDHFSVVTCKCGYSYTYREYRRSCNAVNMPGGRATPIFEHFSQKWPNCKNSTQKMMLIDWLIHECHVTLMSGQKGRSVCINLIEGTLKQISDLIIELAYGNIEKR
jgi:hypothetical protein